MGCTNNSLADHFASTRVKWADPRLDHACTHIFGSGPNLH